MFYNILDLIIGVTIIVAVLILIITFWAAIIFILDKIYKMIRGFR